MRPADLALIAQTRADLASGRARETRQRARVSAAEVARTLGVSDVAVHYWETGRNSPSAEHALAYGKLLRDLGKVAA